MNIVILGGSRGIGKAAAAELAKDGHRLLLVGRDADALYKARQELGGETKIFQGDITSEAEAGLLTEYIGQSFPPDGVVFNAAAFPDPRTARSVLKPSVRELQEILHANLTAHYRLAQLLLPLLRERGGGRMVFVGSTAGIRQDKGGIYGISKWALNGYVHLLRNEAKAYGVSVSLVNPGGVYTERRKKETTGDVRLLETSDLGIVIGAIFRLSRQAVVEELNIRPIDGDTY